MCVGEGAALGTCERREQSVLGVDVIGLSSIDKRTTVFGESDVQAAAMTGRSASDRSRRSYTTWAPGRSFRRSPSRPEGRLGRQVVGDFGRRRVSGPVGLGESGTIDRRFVDDEVWSSIEAVVRHVAHTGDRTNSSALEVKQ